MKKKIKCEKFAFRNDPIIKSIANIINLFWSFMKNQDCLIVDQIYNKWSLQFEKMKSSERKCQTLHISIVYIIMPKVKLKGWIALFH